jgi:hypothetical protein
MEKPAGTGGLFFFDPLPGLACRESRKTVGLALFGSAGPA